ncbi:MAG: PqqD family protein [Aridibacter sp.]
MLTISKSNPISRNKELVIQELKDEVLIYDLKEHKAFCLNETSALVWQACDGKKSVTEISQSIGGKLNKPVTEDLVYLALDQLKNDNLLANPKEIIPNFNGLSRREVIKKVGLASMIALPVISSLITPTAAMAGSAACPGNLTSIVCGAATDDKFNGTCAQCLASLPACCAPDTVAASACSITAAGCATCTRTCA